MSVRGLPTLTILRNTAWTSPEPISTRLAVGQHFGTCTCGSDEGGEQRLRIVNNTNGFGYKGETIRMSVRGLPTLTILSKNM